MAAHCASRLSAACVSSVMLATNQRSLPRAHATLARNWNSRMWKANTRKKALSGQKWQMQQGVTSRHRYPARVLVAFHTVHILEFINSQHWTPAVRVTFCKHLWRQAVPLIEQWEQVQPPHSRFASLLWCLDMT